MKVDLPAPLSPRIARTSPAWMSTSTSASAWRAPNRLVIDRACSKGGDIVETIQAGLLTRVSGRWLDLGPPRRAFASRVISDQDGLPGPDVFAHWMATPTPATYKIARKTLVNFPVCHPLQFGKPCQASSAPRGLRRKGRTSPNSVWLRQFAHDL